MHEQAPFYVDPQRRSESPVGVFQLDLEDVRIERRLHRVVADFADPAFDGVQPIERNALDPACPVFHPEDRRAAAPVGQGGQFIGEVVPARARDATVVETDALELQPRILAEPDAASQLRIGHPALRSAPANR